jgi:hypothetical protein
MAGRLRELLGAVGSVVALAVACASTARKTSKPTPAPAQGGAEQEAAGGTNAAGEPTGVAGQGEVRSEAAGEGGRGSGGEAGGESGTRCSQAADCPANGFCVFGFCQCGVARPELCPASAAAATSTNALACVSTRDDPDNCGTCGVQCAPGAGCIDGECGAEPILLTASPGCGSMQLAIADETLYWSEKQTGLIRSMPLAGGAVTDLATGQVSPTRVMADANGVYWTVDGDASPDSIKLMRKALPPTSDAPETLVERGASYPFNAIALRANKLYYTAFQDLRRLSLDDPALPDVLFGRTQTSGNPAALALSDTLLVWITNTGNVGARDLSAPTDPSDVSGYLLLAEHTASSRSLALDSAYVYLSNGNALERSPLDGTMPVPESPIMTTPNYDPITAFVIDEGHVYAAAERGLLLKHSLLPPTDPADPKTIVFPEAIARAQVGVSSLLLHGEGLYWVNADCEIRTLAR